MKQNKIEKRVFLGLLATCAVFALAISYSSNHGQVAWADGGGGGMDMGGGSTTTTAGGLQLTYAAFPGHVAPSTPFSAVFIVANGGMTVNNLSITLTYELISGTLTDVGTATVSQGLAGIYVASITPRYTGQYRLTFSFVNSDATITEAFLQAVSHPHSDQSGASGELEAHMENYNGLTAAVGQQFEFELEGDDVATAATEIVVHIQDQSGLIDLGTRTLTLNAATGTYDTPANIDFSGGAPKWDITIATTNFGTKTFTITLP